MPKSIRPSLFTLLLLNAFASVAAVLYTPALPAIIKDFSVDADLGQLTMTLFLIGYAVGQWFYGPITNRFGRKPTLYFGIFIGIAGSLICAIAGVNLNFSLFLVGRVIQALGTSVGLVLAFSIINDVYSGAHARKTISYMSLSFSILPGVSIFIGGLLVHYFNWETCFYFLVLYSFFVMLLVARLPETSEEKDYDALRFSEILGRYGKLLGEKHLVGYASMWGLSTAIIYIFAASAPIICIRLLGISAPAFGVANLSTSAALIIGSLISAKVAARFSGRTVMLFGVVLLSIGAALLVLLTLLHAMNLFSFFAPVVIVYIALPLILANASAMATQGLTDRATASSLMTLINMTLAVLSLLAVQSLPLNLLNAMTIGFAVVTVLQWLLFIGLKEAKKMPQ